MTTFTLTMFPDGRAILSTKELFSKDTLREIRSVFEEWRAHPSRVLLLTGCEVQQVTSIEIDLPITASAAV